MSEKLPLPRLGFSPGEFATLFGKSQTWGYRQIYAGKVKTITAYGRTLIPAKEIERILETAGIYNGRPETPSVKARLARLKKEKQSVWRKFVEARKRAGGKPNAPNSTDCRFPSSGGSRGAAMERLAKVAGKGR